MNLLDIFFNKVKKTAIFQNHLSASFPIMTPDIAVPFSTAHAVIYASYAGSIISATLTVTSEESAGS